MTTTAIERCHRLAGSLAELKAKVRAALATELASAVGSAVRDVLVVALVDRLIDAPTRTPARSSTPPYRPASAGWRDADDRGRDEWGYPRDPWDDPDEDADRRPPARYTAVGDDEPDDRPAVPVTAALAAGVNLGRWWLARNGTVPAAVGVGVLATLLGVAGGPVARAALAVLAVAADVLAAEAALARPDPS